MYSYLSISILRDTLTCKCNRLAPYHILANVNVNISTKNEKLNMRINSSQKVNTYKKLFCYHFYDIQNLHNLGRAIAVQT